MVAALLINSSIGEEDNGSTVEIVNVLKDILHGEYPVRGVLPEKMSHNESRPTFAMEQILVDVPETHNDTVKEDITRRETEVLSYVARGYGNKQIASELSISEQTIKNHMSSILQKLDANDRTQAAVMALRKGWITV